MSPTTLTESGAALGGTILPDRSAAIMPADDVAETYGLTRTTILAVALIEDDTAEDKGMHGDDRRTCWSCGTWAPADHVHPFGI